VRRPHRERGMALIAVIAVLIALVLIATPFLIQMQNASKRSESVWSTEEVDQEARNAFSLMQLYLLGSTDPMERQNAANKADGPHNTPDYDTLDAVLRLYVEEREAPGPIAEQLGLAPELVRDVIRMVDRNEYKRQQAAPGLKVTTKAFGIGRRFPIAQRFSQ